MILVCLLFSYFVIYLNDYASEEFNFSYEVHWMGAALCAFLVCLLSSFMAIKHRGFKSYLFFGYCLIECAAVILYSMIIFKGNYLTLKPIIFGPFDVIITSYELLMLIVGLGYGGYNLLCWVYDFGHSIKNRCSSFIYNTKAKQ